MIRTRDPETAAGPAVRWDRTQPASLLRARIESEVGRAPSRWTSTHPLKAAARPNPTRPLASDKTGSPTRGIRAGVMA